MNWCTQCFIFRANFISSTLEKHAKLVTKTWWHGDVDEEVDGWIDNDYTRIKHVCHKEDLTVEAIVAKFVDSESCQGQGDAGSSAQKIEAGHHHKHPHQNHVTFRVRTAKKLQDMITE